MIEEIRTALLEMVQREESRHAEVKEELAQQRLEIERAGRQTYLLGQAQRGLSEEVGGLPTAWRRFVEEAEGRAVAKDPRAEVLAGLMPLKDTFIAVHHQEFSQSEVWREVFAALENRLDQTLKDLGAQVLAEPGMRFDARVHSAVLAAHSSVPAGTVLVVLRQGYALSGAVQRLAEVQVSLGPAPEPPAGDAGSGDGEPVPDALRGSVPSEADGADPAQAAVPDPDLDQPSAGGDQSEIGEDEADDDRRD